MNERDMIEGVLRSALDAAEGYGARHIRVINVALYDQRVDADLLEREFDTLARGSLAEGARLHLDYAILPQREPALAAYKPGAVSLESVELE